MSPKLTCPACGYKFPLGRKAEGKPCPRCETIIPKQNETSDRTEKLETFDKDQTEKSLSGQDELESLEFSEEFPVSVHKTDPQKEKKKSKPKPQPFQKPLPQPNISPRSYPAREPSKLLYSSSNSSSHSSMQRLLDAFAPTVLVCVLFFGWVIYDRSIRYDKFRSTTDSEMILAQALINYQKGERKEAIRLAEEAKKVKPDSFLADQLQKLFNNFSIRSKKKARRQRRRR